jgi:hypothetical protein
MHGAIDREHLHQPAPHARIVAAQRRRDEVQAIGDRIATLAAHIHAATYRLLVLLREFDDRHGCDGWVSCAQWLSWRTGISLEAAREKVRVARVLPELPRISAAFERGALSYSKVRAMTRIATPDTEELLLKIAVHGTAAQLERVVRGYRRAHPGETDEANRDQEARYLATRRDERGNLVIEARLPAELGARFLQALDAAVDASAFPRKRGGADNRTWGQRRTDALVLLADSALAAGLPGRRAADTHQIVVHVDAAVLESPAADGRSELEDGSRVSAETSRRLACDASVVTVREDENGEVLSVGRARRTVPPAIRRALRSRDPGCRFPGCNHEELQEALADLGLDADTIPRWDGAPIDYGVAVAALFDLERRGLERPARALT